MKKWTRKLIVLPHNSLAYAELYLTVATIFRRFDMELHNTTNDDIKIYRDRFFGAPKDGSLGVRVTITGVQQWTSPSTAFFFLNSIADVNRQDTI